MSSDGDIGRVGDNDVEPAGQRRGPVADDKLAPAPPSPSRTALSRAVAAAPGAMSIPTPLACRQLGQQRQQQAAGAGAEIEEAVGPRRDPAGGPAPPRRASRFRGADRACRATSRNSRPQNSRSPEDPAQRLVRQHPAPAMRRSAPARRRDQRAFRMGEDFGRPTGRAPPRAAGGRAGAARRTRPAAKASRRHVRARADRLAVMLAGSRVDRGQLGGAVRGGQRVDDLVERLAGHTLSIL